MTQIRNALQRRSSSVGRRLQFCDQGPDGVGYGSHSNRTHRFSATVHQIGGDSAGHDCSPKQRSFHHGSFVEHLLAGSLCLPNLDAKSGAFVEPGSKMQVFALMFDSRLSIVCR
jgi:hypothetical protein